MACVQVIKCKDTVYSTALAPDGQQLAIAGKGVWLLDVRSGEMSKVLHEHCGHESSVTFSPDGTTLLAAGHAGIMHVRGTCVEKLRGHLRGHSHGAWHVAISPNGRMLASTSAAYTVVVQLTDDWHAPPTVLTSHTAYVSCVSFSCDDRLLASCSHNGTVRVWHIPSEGTAAATAGQALEVGRRVHCVAFSPVDSTLLAYGSNAYGPERSHVVLARVGADAISVERRLQGHTLGVYSLAFSSCGRKLASGSFSTVWIWSVASGACLHVLKGHTGWVSGVSFFPGGKQLVSGCHDGTVRVWTLCAWSDHNHHLFSTQLKRTVFLLMCVRAHLMLDLDVNIPIELWLMVFKRLALL